MIFLFNSSWHNAFGHYKTYLAVGEVSISSPDFTQIFKEVLGGQAMNSRITWPNENLWKDDERKCKKMPKVK